MGNKEESRLYYQLNKARLRAYQKRYYNEHLKYQKDRLERQRLRTKKVNLELKINALSHYGNDTIKCVICGETRLPCLSIDHINGGGNQERKREYHGHLYWWLKKRNYPEGYQTLCMNCQWIKRAEQKECQICGG